jgi:hypothetical protein
VRTGVDAVVADTVASDGESMVGALMAFSFSWDFGGTSSPRLPGDVLRPSALRNPLLKQIGVEEIQFFC